MYKKPYLLIIFLSLLFSGCGQPIGGEIFFNQINALEDSISHTDWEETKLQMDELIKIYEETLWKLQLLGDEGEYEGLHESLERLKPAVDQEDKLQALLELATIKGYLEGIYSM
ncbi:DUF4363 family protein [Ornithinibacillus xuwenensis]|uniref:DUF4363 family protein n=1 Tax=Ornithinibacillus xuwenensis TaxID=3144668 RepID=A0ABU9XGN3_9BACI